MRGGIGSDWVFYLWLSPSGRMIVVYFDQKCDGIIQDRGLAWQNSIETDVKVIL